MHNKTVRAVIVAASLSMALALSACEEKMPEVQASESAAAESSDVPLVDPSGDASGSVAAGVAAGLDMGALGERRDPERLLRYYTNAIRIGDWGNAARAWSLDAQMTPAKLEGEFGGAAGPKLAVGKGDVEGAAGSLYYEAPLVIDFADGRASKRGTIVLRRVNDVAGASDEQLNWRIERTSTLTQ